MLEKLSDSELHQLFLKCYKAVGNTSKRFPQDILLQFYSYGKLATNETKMQFQHLPQSSKDLIDAFKANAMFQIQQIDPREAKIAYIKLANQELEGINRHLD